MADVMDYREWAVRQITKGKLTEKQITKLSEWEEVEREKENVTECNTSKTL